MAFYEDDMLPRSYSFKKFFLKLRKGSEYLDYGRDIILNMVEKYIIETNCYSPKILDLGAGQGIDLGNIAKSFRNHKLDLYGIDNYEPNIKAVMNMGIPASQLNIERESLPYCDQYFDIIIVNQVIEHTKEIFFIFSEISRVLKFGGLLIVGFPNLAALHNRILLLLGKQPICSRMLGPHIRSITKDTFMKFVTAEKYFEMQDIKGANFYPFPAKLSTFLCKIFPTLSISLFFSCIRTNKPGKFIEVLDTRFFETDYFRGE